MEFYAWALRVLPAESTIGGFELEELLGCLPGSVATRRDYYNGWRVFFRWAVSRQLMTRNPLDGVKPPRSRPRRPKALTEPQMRRLVAVARERSRRDLAVIMLLLDTGLRLGELHGLTWAEVGDEYLRVDGKTGAREVPISGEVRALLVGVDLPFGRSVDNLYRIVKRCMRAAGVEAGGPHTLRHTFALHYVRAGGDPFSLQRIMGHRDISTTRIYVEMALGDVLAQHRRFSPALGLLRAV